MYEAIIENPTSHFKSNYNDNMLDSKLCHYMN